MPAGPHPARKYLRLFGQGMLLVLTFPLLYLFFALVLGLVPVHAGFRQPAEGVDIYVSTNGAHADLVVPACHPHMDWHRFLWPERPVPADCSQRYIAFGWGDRGFYLETPTWNDLRFPVALRALFWPSASAMHVDHLHRPPPPHPDHQRIRITPQQYGQLVEHIRAGFALDGTGSPQPIHGISYTHSDAFYEGRGSYQLFRTSNSWTAEGLRRSGVRTALWSPFDRGLMYHARRIQ
jgi:uncharacterized protein (TIGR02117 family)